MVVTDTQNHKILQRLYYYYERQHIKSRMVHLEGHDEFLVVLEYSKTKTSFYHFYKNESFFEFMKTCITSKIKIQITTSQDHSIKGFIVHRNRLDKLNTQHLCKSIKTRSNTWFRSSNLFTHFEFNHPNESIFEVFDRGIQTFCVFENRGSLLFISLKSKKTKKTLTLGDNRLHRYSSKKLSDTFLALIGFDSIMFVDVINSHFVCQLKLTISKFSMHIFTKSNNFHVLDKQNSVIHAFTYNFPNNTKTQTISTQTEESCLPSFQTLKTSKQYLSKRKASVINDSPNKDQVIFYEQFLV